MLRRAEPGDVSRAGSNHSWCSACFWPSKLVTANVIEPWLYGQSIGVSEVALLVSAAFWAFLWGPVGLVLSSPLTVCLVVLGKYVPQLEFLDVLLGDEPALDPGRHLLPAAAGARPGRGDATGPGAGQDLVPGTGLRRAAGAGLELRQTGPRARRPDGSRRSNLSSRRRGRSSKTWASVRRPRAGRVRDLRSRRRTGHGSWDARCTMNATG